MIRQLELKPKLYIFTNCLKKNCSTEIWYLNILKRKYRFTFENIIKVDDFLKKSKSRNSELGKIYYIAIIDVDIDYNDLENSIKARCHDLGKLFSNDKIYVVLSNRCFENWLVYHFSDWNQYTTNCTKIPILQYEKKSNWFMKNDSYLINTIEIAQQRARKRRACTDIDIKDFNDLNQNYKKEIISLMVNTNPFTNFDLLIDELVKM